MQNLVHVHPAKLGNFSDRCGRQFVVLTTPSLLEHIRIETAQSPYAAHTVAAAATLEEAHRCIAGLADWSHILVIMPEVYFRSPESTLLGPCKMLGVLACYSTPTGIDAINHFLRQAERTDARLQERFADYFFGVGQRAAHLEFIDDTYGTRAVFQHLDDTLMWHEQVGALQWGQQQLLPSGEISALPVGVFDQDISRALNVSGEITLRGTPILHGGSVSFQRADQARIYDALCTLRGGAVRATVDAGRITTLKAIGPEAAPAASYLNMLCGIDSRYSFLIELGFGCNFNHDLLAINSAMNEVHGNPAGVLHFGFGLLPFTQYHLDVICPQTRVVSAAGVDLLGPRANTADIP